MTRIFISYRREDSADVSGRIRDRLEMKYGKEAVFTDVDSIPLGANFKEHIGLNVGQCKVFLPVIGPLWLTIKDNSGLRRLDSPKDFVKAEIEAALQRNIPVIPLLVQGASMPSAGDLPESINELAFRNSIPVRPDPDFRKDMDRLIKGISHYLKNEPQTSASHLIDQEGDGSRKKNIFRKIKGRFLIYTIITCLFAVGLWSLSQYKIFDATDQPATEESLPAKSKRTYPDWRTAAAEVRIVDGNEYYEVDFNQGFTASLVCGMLGKVPGEFVTDTKVCKAFNPDASILIAKSGDKAVVYCSGKEKGVCAEYENACVTCPDCKYGVGLNEFGGKLYGKMYTTCRAAN